VNLNEFQEGPHKYRPVWVITVLGLLLRSYHYLRNPALWHDEAVTVLNVLRKSFTELLGPLYGSATGPPLFLWVQKCAVLCLGESTYSLRLVSFLASCAALLVMAVLVPRLLQPIPAAACMLVLACSDRLLWHAAEARHYSTDVFIASGLALLFVVSRKWATQRRILCFACVAPFVILASYPGVFLCAGSAIAFLYVLLRHKQRLSEWLALMALALSIAGAFLVLFFTTASVQRTTPLDAAWLRAFPDWRHPLRVPLWFILSTVGVVDYMTRPIGGILALVACIGAVRWWRGGERELVLFLVAPLGFAASAGLANAYPYTGARTMVFAITAIALMIGAGIQGACEWIRGSQLRAWLAGSVIALPLLATLLFSIYRLWVPWPRADTSGAAAYVLEHRAEGDAVTANHWEYEYYFRKLDGSFYPGLRLLQQEHLPRRYWVVLTSGDPTFATTLGNSLQHSRVLERREFFRTTVMLVTNDTN
jgi:hypothetical protein